MSIWDDIGQFIATVEAEEKRIQQQQNGLNIGTPSAAGGGSGFQIDPTELQSLLVQWKDLDDTLTTAIVQVTPHGSNTAPPAQDDASLTATDATTGSMASYLTHLQAMQTYAQNYVQSLTKALKNYQAAEAGNRGSAANVHTSLKA